MPGGKKVGMKAKNGKKIAQYGHGGQIKKPNKKTKKKK